MVDAPSPELLNQLQLVDNDPVVVSQDAADALAKLVDEALELKTVIDTYKEALSAAKERMDVLTRDLIPNGMRAAGMVDASGHGKMSHRSGAKLHLRHDLNAYVVAAEKPALHQWLRAHAHGDLIREEVNAQTLKAFCKEQQEAGAEMPPMVKTSPETLAVITVPKSKGEA